MAQVTVKDRRTAIFFPRLAEMKMAMLLLPCMEKLGVIVTSIPVSIERSRGFAAMMRTHITGDPSSAVRPI